MLDTAAHNYCDVDEFKKFIYEARYNDRFEYYRGLGITDTVLSAQLGKIAYKHATEGRIYIVQRRIHNKFSFIAIKASTPPVTKLIPFTDEKAREKHKKSHHYQKHL